MNKLVLENIYETKEIIQNINLSL